MSLRTSLSAVAAAFLVLAASGCDTTEVFETTATYVDFRIDTSNRDNSINDSEGASASFTDDDVISPDDRDRLRSALSRAGDGALVLAYVNSDLLFSGSTGQTFSALPLTRGYEASLDLDGDGVGETPIVDYTISYEYSFDNGSFYFDVTSSADLGALPLDDLNFSIPSTIDFRVVTLPATAAFAQAGARVDFRDYEAVKAAYGLPD